MPDRDSPSIVPKLPSELIDDIVDRALTVLDDQSLSSMALTTQHFRVKVNQKRFSAVILDSIFGRNCSDLSNRLNCFAILVDGQRRLTPRMINVASFVNSFEFSMVPQEGENPPFIDAAMTVLCNNLFRETPGYRPRTDEFTFKFEPWNHSYSDKHYHWETFRMAMRHAFVDLVRRSKLTSLQIAAICSMPVGALQGSKIKHLHLRQVSINPSLDLSSPLLSPVILESLFLDGLVSYRTLCGLFCGRYDSASNLFTRLTNLKVTLRAIDDVDTANQILTNATSLDTLVFTRTVEEAQEGRMVHYGHLQRLRRLCIFPTSVNCFPMDRLLGDEVPESLLEIQVLFSYYLTSAEVHDNMFPLIDFSYVDTHLSHRRYGSIRRFVITLHTVLGTGFNLTGLDLATFGGICRDSVRDSLPRLCRAFSESLNIRIDFIPSSSVS
ncbi:hypothetical protein JR316_0008534 [Psilocybe cubensis]|uniref:Uncharacterized protein n=2 Tax=Psilocybe cubensis TaxID=181762 RepID=A0ACB8GX44_PSICU|nr:hypothetical protein JR316_0008534 [Psilocybe cubensis]KAH9479937.1 hypothetical protein JR316_0008534 [Psilocybe cubensis]